MKYYTFKRESNDFSDILSDVNVKKYIRTKIRWLEHLMIGLAHTTQEGVYGYIVLKYGEDICNLTEKNYTPIPFVDYVPKR
jgi:hypothetical protein